MKQITSSLTIPRFFVLVVGVAFALPRTAHADFEMSLDDYHGHWLLAGLLFSYGGDVGRNAGEFGIGAEASYMYRPGKGAWGIGSFLQLEAPALERFRACTGIQAMYTAFGVELGGAVELPGGSNAGVAQIHVAPFVSIAFLSVAVRVDVPAWTFSAGQQRATSVALVITIKLPKRLFPKGEHWWG